MGKHTFAILLSTRFPPTWSLWRPASILERALSAARITPFPRPSGSFRIPRNSARVSWTATYPFPPPRFTPAPPQNPDRILTLEKRTIEGGSSHHLSIYLSIYLSFTWSLVAHESAINHRLIDPNPSSLSLSLSLSFLRWTIKGRWSVKINASRI